MSLRADILSIVHTFDQHDEQDITNVDTVMVDCQQCEYSDTFDTIDAASLYVRGHRLVSNHYNFDIGVQCTAQLQTIDCTIRVGDTIES